jgi:hypothetical protein
MRQIFWSIFFGVCAMLFLSVACERVPTSLNEELNEEMSDETVTFIRKRAGAEEVSSAKRNSNSKEESPYSCLVSTLNEDDAEYNYDNRAFWLHFPSEIIKDARGKEVYNAFSFSDVHAGHRAGTWGGQENIVRVAQCKIPDSELAEELLVSELMKFGKGTWYENRKSKSKQFQNNTILTGNSSNVNGVTAQSGEWVCLTAFITRLCIYYPDTGEEECTITDIQCIEYTYVSENDPGSGGGPGDPSDDPGECDPMGTEPCFDDGGGSVPPPEPDPCDDDNPPTYCENPCETGNSHVDAIESQITMDNGWIASYGSENNPLPHDQRNEKMFIIIDKNSHFDFTEIEPNDVSSCHFIASGISIPSNAIGFFHTHPYAPDELITDQRCLDYRGWDVETYGYPKYNAENVSAGDSALVSATGLPIYVIDNEKIRTIDPSDPSEYSDTDDRCGY